LAEEAGAVTPLDPPYRVALRSLVFPGWGQLYNKQYVKALVVFACESALLGTIYGEYRLASEAYDRHLSTEDVAEAERLYAEYEKHFERQESLIWWTAGLVLFSLADAYVDANLATFEDEFGDPPGRVSLYLEPDVVSGGGFLCLKYNF
jgi:hypothetical protein